MPTERRARALLVLTLAITTLVVPTSAQAQDGLFEITFDFTDESADVATNGSSDVQRGPRDIPQVPSTVRAALLDSLRLLMIEHSTRLAF